MTTETLASALEGFLSGSSGAVVIEDGAVMFDLGQAKYSVSGERNKCLLHFWSEERNVVRRVLDVESTGESLRVTVQRMGRVRQGWRFAASAIRERHRRGASRGQLINISWSGYWERVSPS
jgi:hypothetical protein